MLFYFLLVPYEGPTKANYQHSCVLIAEGLKQAGHEVQGNIDYFPDMSGNYTICKAPTQAGTVDYVITSCPENFVAEIRTLASTKTKIIIIDTKDEWIRPKSAQFLSVAHRYFMSTAALITPKIKPWVFGITDRILHAARTRSWSERKPGIVWAHRVDNHQLRNLVKDHYTRKNLQVATYLDNFAQPTPAAAAAAAAAAATHYWNQTGRRHSPAYFEFLANHRYLDAHGGYHQSQNRIVQWDSWKVWEGFVAGCLVITADLDYYNILLPHPLIPFKHYIPVRYDQLDVSYDRLFRLPDAEQERIAVEGHRFVMEHYTSKPLAAYLLDNLVPN
jgi:hypothetical protein